MRPKIPSCSLIVRRIIRQFIGCRFPPTPNSRWSGTEGGRPHWRKAGEFIRYDPSKITICPFLTGYGPRPAWIFFQIRHPSEFSPCSARFSFFFPEPLRIIEACIPPIWQSRYFPCGYVILNFSIYSGFSSRWCRCRKADGLSVYPRCILFSLCIWIADIF